MAMTVPEKPMKFILQEEDFIITFESGAVTTDEILAHVVQFMLACGYQEESIHAALQETLDERKDLLKARLVYDAEANKDLV